MALDRSKKRTIIDVRINNSGFRVGALIEMLNSQSEVDEEATKIVQRMYASYADLPAPAKQFIQSKIT